MTGWAESKTCRSAYACILRMWDLRCRRESILYVVYRSLARNSH